MELREILVWIVGGGGAAGVAYWLMERITLPEFSSEHRRYISLALAAVLGGLAFVASVGLGYRPMPANAQGWLESLFSVAFVAVAGGQALHGRLRLREKAQ